MGSEMCIRDRLITASFLYGSMLVYFLDDGFHGTKFVDAFSSVVQTSDIKKTYKSSDQKTYLKPTGLSITEERSVIGVMVFSIFLFLIVPILTLKERKANIYHTVQVPLIFVSFLLILSFVTQSIRFGVF